MEATVCVVAGGDIMLVLGMIPLLRRYGAQYPFQRVQSLMCRADVLVANLEAPFTTRNTPTPYKNPVSVRARRDYILRADPEAGEALRFAGFDAVGLANNHMMDYQEGGLLDTLCLLQSLGIAYAGAGRNLSEARRPAWIERKGWRTALLSYSCILPVGSVATASRAGIAPARGAGVEAMIKEDIAQTRAQSDCLIVSIHWGKQLANYPDRLQQRLGHRLIEWGADVVVGHHPHVLQGVEVYRGKIIAYSLGDLVNLSSRRETALLQVVLDKPHSVSCACLIPLRLERGQLRYPDKDSWRSTLSRVSRLSAPFHTRFDAFGWIDLG